MTPSQIVVPSTSGAQGETIEDFVLDRVSGDVEKNLGQVLENAFDGATVPIAGLIVLDSVNSIRRLYVGPSSGVPAGLQHATKATRQTNIVAALTGILDTADPISQILEVADVESTLKGKTWNVGGLTQTAEVSGASEFALLDSLFVPTRKSFTLASLVAKLEDLALTNQSVAIFVNQAFPEVVVAATVAGEILTANVADALGAEIYAQVNAIFISASTEATPSFGFESGGGF